MRCGRCERALPAVMSFRLSSASPPVSGYREHFLQADLLQAAIVVGLWVASVTLFIVIDYVVTRGAAPFAALLGLRVGFIVLSVIAALSLIRVRSPRRADHIYLAWSLMLVVWGLAINVVYGAEHPSQLAQDMAILLTFYFLTTGPLWLRLLPALVYTLGDVTLDLGHHALDSVPYMVQLLMLVFVNAIGWVVSRQMITSRQSIFAMHQEELALRKEMQALAVTDPLTEAFNRRYLDMALEREFSRAQRHARPLSVLMFDIDHFKRVNDTYGHQVGDRALQAFAGMILRAKREEDLLARFGGEEFVLVAPETDEAAVMVLAERLRQQCEAIQLELDGGLTCRFTVSIGAASVSPDESCCADLLQRADSAMYRAKQGGRNRVIAYQPD